MARQDAHESQSPDILRYDVARAVARLPATFPTERRNVAEQRRTLSTIYTWDIRKGARLFRSIFAVSRIRFLPLTV
jgi:hypothetical protein